MKNAFTLLEIIVVIVIIAIISSMGVYKLFFSLDESQYLQVKTQVHHIQNAISKKRNASLLMGEQNEHFDLDDAQNNTKESLLFTHILNQPLISTSNAHKEMAKWMKLSSTKYAIYLSKDELLEFTYDSSKGTFECDFSLNSCKELYQ